MTAERVQKILARAGVAARRKAEDLIRAGRVTINGRIAVLGDKADPESDSIKVDDRRVRLGKDRHYYLLNKPKGYLTAVSDPRGRPTVLDLLPPQMRRGVVPVGRLDFNTEGLLILTDDGELAQKVAHPRYGCRKIYEAKVKGKPQETEIQKLERGIVLDGRRTAPVRIRWVKATAREPEEGNSWFRIELTEGRSRQIREMFFRIGHPVQKLRRIAIGPLSDPEMPVGAFRPLDPEEVASLQRSSSPSGSRKPGLRRRSPPAPPKRKRIEAGGSERKTRGRPGR